MSECLCWISGSGCSFLLIQSPGGSSDSSSNWVTFHSCGRPGLWPQVLPLLWPQLHLQMGNLCLSSKYFFLLSKENEAAYSNCSKLTVVQNVMLQSAAWKLPGVPVCNSDLQTSPRPLPFFSDLHRILFPGLNPHRPPHPHTQVLLRKPPCSTCSWLMDFPFYNVIHI